MKDIKILISCHKEVELFKSSIMMPIQVGCALNEKRFPGMLRDDEGENISKKNLEYCELTALYWAWKNLNADYYGFFHYRRYLNFSSKRYPLDCWQNVVEDNLYQSISKKYGIDDGTMRKVIEENDIVISEMKDVSAMLTADDSVYEQYKNGHSLNIHDLDIVCEIIRERYPEYIDDLETYMHGKMTCLCNMFIMRRELFMDYAEWLFDILDEFAKRSDMSDYSIEGLRTPGHLAERLLTLYYLHLKRTRDLAIKTLQTVVFINTEPEFIPEPAFEKHNAVIVLSANDFYVPYVSTLLESLRHVVGKKWNYDVIIMHQDISTKNQTILRKQLFDRPNISLRFLSVGRYSKVFEKMSLRGHFKIETYFRLIMPQILRKYEKALYLDSDMILNADPAELYATDVTGYLLAACHDVDTAGLYNGFEPGKKAYMDHVLKIKKPYDYFQAGVILFNLSEFRKQYKVKEMLKFASSYKWELLDQDVLNYLAQGKVRYVDLAWNVMNDWAGIRVSQIIALAPHYMNKDYMRARKEPKIIHYAGPDKPWQHPYEDMAEEFWKYARNSPFYEVLLQRMCATYTPNMKERMKNIGMPIVNTVFPYHTQRRELLKKCVKKMKK